MGTHTTREIVDIQGNLDFWQELENEQWKLISFTDQTSARYGWLYGERYTKYVTITAHICTFMRGVAPDVLDKF